MRYIDLEILEIFLSDKWMERAQKAYQKAKNPTPDKSQTQVIEEHSSIWRDIKNDLKQLFHGKCWYCESSAHRIIGDVDHHRPKKAIEPYPPGINEPTLPGYWWLAFEWRNFRYTCEICNRLNRDLSTNLVKGKGSFFPLVDPSKRIGGECDYDELFSEDPLLLDPTVADDPLLLTFDLNGMAKPACEETENPVNYLRAKISIEIYHLNHIDLKRRRQLEICGRVRKLVKRMDIYA